MLSAFRYRIYPKPEQEMRLNRSLLNLCKLYNSLRAEAKRRYREEHRSTSLIEFRQIALDARKHDEELKSIYSQVVQNEADPIHLAFKNFFRKRARYPRQKKPHKYNSLTYTQSGFKITERKGLYLSKIGYIRMFMHRPLLGDIRRLTIKREADEWYAVFITEREMPQKMPIQDIPAERIRGADLGLKKFAVFDDSTSIEHPKFLRRSEDRIRHIQHHFSRKQKGSKRRRMLGRMLTKLHLSLARQRKDFQNKLIHNIFKENDVLILEKLNVSSMLHNHRLSKSISDASWNKFAIKAMSKADMLGKHTIFVGPWGTTQFCNKCLSWVPKDLSERAHLPGMWRKAAKGRELSHTHQKAWHP
jgi:putative transposase